MERTAVNAEEDHRGPGPFSEALAKRGLGPPLTKRQATGLQINVGLLCNQACRHCHLEAGPDRTEVMDSQTVDELVSFARRGRFQLIDITGGAPELNPNLCRMIEQLAPLAPRLLLRSNLTALARGDRDELIHLCRRHRVVVVASLPSLNRGQTDAQRGNGVFERSIAVLRRLNASSYGQGAAGLEINLSSNPTGAFLPVPQGQAERRFRLDLQRKWGVSFTNLFTFANVPLGRFLGWLVETGNYDSYMLRLAESFTPCTLEGLMCRSLVSISWDGYVYDCDFNQAKGLFTGDRRVHVSEMEGPPAPGTPIAMDDHCYACTAGSGFTCGGAIVT
jgi:radical SAM/Cys-rich protein